MNSERSYDFLLAGASGQVGRYLLRELQEHGSVAVVMRRPSVSSAQSELSRLVGGDWTALKDVTVIPGDVNTCELPRARHIVNAAGFTSLSGPPEDYWKANIMPAIRLAHHANATGAKLHQLSSVAVAEFRDDILYEESRPIPDGRQLTYSTSKVLMELAVSAVKPDTQILRLGDVVPPLDRLEIDWRRSHWLSILFASGPAGFQFVPPEYTVWLADAAELAAAIAILMDKPGHCYHVLGKRYSWSFFRENAALSARPRIALTEWMTKIVMHGPEGGRVNEDFTYRTLQEEDFEWTLLNPAYWKAFGERSVANVAK